MCDTKAMLVSTFVCSVDMQFIHPKISWCTRNCKWIIMHNITFKIVFITNSIRITISKIALCFILSPIPVHNISFTKDKLIQGIYRIYIIIITNAAIFKFKLYIRLHRKKNFRCLSPKLRRTIYKTIIVNLIFFSIYRKTLSYFCHNNSSCLIKSNDSVVNNNVRIIYCNIVTIKSYTIAFHDKPSIFIISVVCNLFNCIPRY